MDKTVFVNIADRKKRFKFCSTSSQRDVESLKAEIERVAKTDRRLQRSIRGKTMVVSRYYEQHKSEFELGEDECIEDGSLLNINLVKDSSSGDEECREAPAEICRSLATDLSRKRTIPSSTTKSQVPQKHESMNKVPRIDKEDSNYGQFAKSTVTCNSSNLSPQLTTREEAAKDCTTELKKKLQDFYKITTLLNKGKHTSWMEKVGAKQLKDYCVNLELKEKKINFNEIFQETATDEKFNSILIKGEHGFGKTTLLKKLLFDWAKNIDYTQRFELAFFVPLKEVDRYDIGTILQEIAKRADFHNEDDLHRAIEKNAKKTLILMDGLDELPKGNTRDEVLRALNEEKYADITFVVTSRNDLNVEKKEVQNSGYIYSRTVSLCNRKVTLLGLPEEEIEKILVKLAPDVKDKIKFQLQNDVHSIFRSPLIGMMIGFLNETEKIAMDGSITKLYKGLCNGMIRYSLRRQGIETAEKFDYFSASPKLKLDIHRILFDFGKLCFCMWNQNTLNFEESDLAIELYELGFLTKNESSGIFREGSGYEIFHPSFQQFFVAYYISQEILSVENNEIDIKLLDSLKSSNFKCRFLNSVNFKPDRPTVTLIYRFVAGLLEDKIHFLFEQMKHLDLNGIHYSICLELINECLINEKTTEALMPFLPISFRANDLPNVLKLKGVFTITDFFKKAIENLKMRELKISSYDSIEVLKSLNSFDENVCFSSVEIMIKLFRSDSIENVRKVIDVIHKVSCQTLRFSFFRNHITRIQKKEQVLTNEILLSFAKHSAEMKELEMHDEGLDMFRKFLKTKKIFFPLNKLIVKETEFYLKDLGKDIVQVLDLVPVKALRVSSLVCCSRCDYSSIEQNSRPRKSSCFRKRRLEFDLQMLTNDGKKDWDNLNLEHSTVKCSKPLNTCCQIKHFNVCDVDDNGAKAIADCNISILQCNYNALQKLLNISKFYSETIFRSLTEIYISTDYSPAREAESLRMWSLLNHFQNVKKLFIHFKHASSEKVLMAIADFLKKSKISNVCIITNDLLCLEKHLLPELEKQSTVKSIDIYTNKNFFSVKTLQLLCRKIIENFGIILDDSYLPTWRKWMESFDQSVFQLLPTKTQEHEDELDLLKMNPDRKKFKVNISLRDNVDTHKAHEHYERICQDIQQYNEEIKSKDEQNCM